MHKKIKKNCFFFFRKMHLNWFHLIVSTSKRILVISGWCVNKQS